MGMSAGVEMGLEIELTNALKGEFQNETAIYVFKILTRECIVRILLKTNDFLLLYFSNETTHHPPPLTDIFIYFNMKISKFISTQFRNTTQT